MDYLPLTPIDSKGLRVFSNLRDVLRDLFVYVDYVGQRSVKRMTRSNEIPRPEQQRITKLLGGLSFNPGPDEIDAGQWIGLIDRLAYDLHLTDYDTKGEYRGESSSEPSFIDNYITINQANLDKYFELVPIEQEKKILEALKAPRVTGDYRYQEFCEFFQTSVLGELDSFSARGSATGVLPSLKFPEIRQFLLSLLCQCSPGVWYSSKSLVQYLKTNHPYFLIPEKIRPDRWGTIPGRYDNFYETKDEHSYETDTVNPNAPDAFERVEGRFVERFLESIPLIMRFVDVAYDPAPYKGLFPTLGMLNAFRVNELLPLLMNGVKTQPRVTVQPNFDVIVEADFYPAKIIRQITGLGEQVSTSSTGSTFVGIFQLKKTQVAAEQVRQPSLDVIKLLKELSKRDLPPNVQIELEEWSGHADQFTLYEGFALLETMDEIPQADKYTIERISPNLCLVRNPQELYQSLETESRIPLWVHHYQDGFKPLAEMIISVFPKESAEDTQEVIPQIKLSRSISVIVRFPDETSFDAFCKMLAELRCPFQSDSRLRSITFDQKNQPKFDAAVQGLADFYTVVVE
jgi:hypothetical protein